MEIEKLAEKLVVWIRERVLAARCKGTVLGMSGGLDSSVLAVLCKRAFSENVLGVMMPCYSCEEDRAHALMVANKASIPTREVILDDTFDTLLKNLPDFGVGPVLSRLAQSNLKSRLRMVTLYYIANQLEYMVTGASNRSELATGYFTKHGDSGVDILPLGNLVKAQVKELADYLDIPKQIIDKPPSAGLWEGQTDEEELGISYDELDRYLLTGEASKEVREKVESMMAVNNHKCSPPPIPAF